LLADRVSGVLCGAGFGTAVPQRRPADRPWSGPLARGDALTVHVRLIRPGSARVGARRDHFDEVATAGARSASRRAKRNPTRETGAMAAPHDHPNRSVRSPTAIELIDARNAGAVRQLPDPSDEALAIRTRRALFACRPAVTDTQVTAYPG